MLRELVRLLEQRQGRAMRRRDEGAGGRGDAGKLGFFRQLLPELTEEALHGRRTPCAAALLSARLRFPDPADQQLVRAFLSGETDALPRAIPHSDNFWYYSDKVVRLRRRRTMTCSRPRCAAVCVCGGRDRAAAARVGKGRGQGGEDGEDPGTDGARRNVCQAGMER
ncbi:MAG: hypothetical protein ACLU9S_21525 [Oscillospiraceae bacterium]